MAKKSIDLWVGIFVAIGLGALFFLALKVGNLLNFREQKNGYEVTARFDNVGNLKPRAAVKSAGVVVGRVESVKLDPKSYEAVVRIHLENNFQFSRDTIAAIFTSGLLGEQFLGLEAGGDTVMLKDEDIVKKTQSAIQIEKLISQFMFSKAQDAPAAPAAAPATGVKP
jgi:phospholipid/cholesterol/gamma-HCH transport system substrate-binding protein